MKAVRRLNLLIFPPETNALFALLMLTAIMLAMLLSNVVYLLFSSGNTLQAIDPVARGARLVMAFLPIVCSSGIMAGVIFVAAFLYYRRHPARVRSYAKLEPLTEKDGAIQQVVSELAMHAGIASAPVIEMPRGLNGTSGLAFGLPGHYAVSLDGGLRVWRKTKPDLFRAIVSHELAHIANDDVWRTYFSGALWWAIAALSIAPLILGIGGYLVWNSFIGLHEGNLFSYLENSIPTATGLLVQGA